jgi:putative transposase
MPNYRRLRLPGATYFFTLALRDRGVCLLTDRVADLRDAYVRTTAEFPLRCDAMVVLPDHLHAVWTLPPGDHDYSERWRRIKARFSRAVGGPPAGARSLRAKRERGIWQRRFWEHTIRDEADFAMHVRYCWGNPVKHGLVARAADWPYSSIHRDIRVGRVEAAWAAAPPEGQFGE